MVMKGIVKFVIDLVIPFVFVVVGGRMLSSSFENDSGFFFWTGLALIAVGIIRGLWLLVTNGVSPWGD